MNTFTKLIIFSFSLSIISCESKSQNPPIPPPLRLIKHYSERIFDIDSSKYIDKKLLDKFMSEGNDSTAFFKDNSLVINAFDGDNVHIPDFKLRGKREYKITNIDQNKYHLNGKWILTVEDFIDATQTFVISVSNKKKVFIRYYCQRQPMRIDIIQ